MAARTRRGRYTAGAVRGRVLSSYIDEPGVEPDRGTETFAETVENWRWSGVPFTLRSGKGLGQDRREVAVTFRELSHPILGAKQPRRPNVLRFFLDPAAITLEVNVNAAGSPFDLAPATLDVEFGSAELPSYAHLLAAVLARDPTLCLRGDEAEQSWRVMEPILTAWAAGAVPLQDYPAGSCGPAHEPSTE